MKKDLSLEKKKMNGGRCKWKRGLQTGGGTEREQAVSLKPRKCPSVQRVVELRRTRVITRFGK